MRDSQRQKLYNAEWSFWNGAYGGDIAGGNSGLPEVADVEAFVAEVLGRRAVRSRYGSVNCWVPRITDGRGARSAYAYGAGEIAVPRALRKRWVLLHELAHILIERTVRADVAPHGWEFAREYAWLVEVVLGADAARGLKAAFRAGRVKHKAPRKGRELTEEEEKAVLRERLAVSRAARQGVV